MGIGNDQRAKTFSLKRKKEKNLFQAYEPMIAGGRGGDVKKVECYVKFFRKNEELIWGG